MSAALTEPPTQIGDKAIKQTAITPARIESSRNVASMARLQAGIQFCHRPGLKTDPILADSTDSMGRVAKRTHSAKRLRPWDFSRFECPGVRDLCRNFA